MAKDQWNAWDYATNSSAQEGWANELIGKLALSGHEVGLDIGCGDGRITSKIANFLPQGKMLGIDASAAMIALAAREHQQDNLHFVEMDATRINLPHTFDFAFSNATLHWIADHEQVLQGLRQHLAAGAKILFQMGGLGNARGMIAAFDTIMKAAQWSAYFTEFCFPYHFYETEQYEVMLPRHGFRSHRTQLIPKDMVHESPAHLKGWLRTTWFPFTNCVDSPHQELFLDEVLEEYLKLNPIDMQGKTHVDMVRLEVEAIAS
jgi:trans-aconitate methyltransferase